MFLNKANVWNYFFHLCFLTFCRWRFNTFFCGHISFFCVTLYRDRKDIRMHGVKGCGNETKKPPPTFVKQGLIQLIYNSMNQSLYFCLIALCSLWYASISFAYGSRLPALSIASSNQR